MLPPVLLSIITPTHGPKYLPEVYASLLTQQYDNWELVVVLNGPAKAGDLHLPPDPRIRIIRDWPEGPAGRPASIGALKRFACERARGGTYVEVDHDDVLVPGTLPKIADAIRSGAGFVYSDSAGFTDKLEPRGYRADWGWQNYPLHVYGHPFVATRTFPLTARSLCEVYYAPDHLRAWSRDAYWAAGGHDPQLAVGDDQDLVCRTYLAGVPFHYTGDCGYLYRWHENNTVSARQPLIQKQNAANRRKYLHPLAAEWCRREGLPTLDLLELWRRDARLHQPFDVWQLKLREQNSYGRIIASDVLQFLQPEQQVEFFNAAYDALVPGGWLHVAVPSTSGAYADMHPLHLTRFNRNSFLYYTRREFAQSLPGIRCRFELVMCEEFYPSDEFKRHDMKVLRAELVALKGQRTPGPNRI